MAMSLQEKLRSAANSHLKEQKKRSFSVKFSLNLAAEILSVDCGLKPCFLYDYNGVGTNQIQSYLKELQHTGFIKEHLHILNIADNILIINVTRTISYLNTLLEKTDLSLVDVSAFLSEPVLFKQNNVSQIHSQLTQLLETLKPYQGGQPDTISVGDTEPVEWNLCTIFGLLLNFPAVYWFDTARGFENCLSLVPLRHFSVRAHCAVIGLTKVQIYSFTIPESVFCYLQKHLEEWTEKLKMTFLGQKHFTDLEIIEDTVTLTAVAL
ncbi:UPF0739 protein C1orf74 homolog [Pelodytes ibericus]